MPPIYQNHERREVLEAEFRAIYRQLDHLDKTLRANLGQTILQFARDPVDTFDHPGNTMLAMAMSLGS